VKTKRSSSLRKAVKTPRPPSVVQALEQRVLFSADVAALALLQAATQATAQVQSQPSTPAAPTSTNQTQPNSQLFVLDLRVTDAQGLLAGLAQQQTQARANNEIFEILTLDWQDDGITKISNALSAQGNVSALHLVGHGDNGMMLLGTTWLDQATLRNRTADFSAWSNGLNSEADILVYGCDFAANQAGQQSVRSLAQITGADVAASVDSTSNISNGGNWVLEYQQGAIQTTTLDVELSATQWQGKLATFIVTNNLDSGAGSLRQALIDANTSNGFDTITFNIGGSGVQTIDIQSAFNDINEGVLIDGTSQIGYAVGAPLIVLNGSNAGANANGISISSNSPVTIRGLVINRFSGNGIAISGGSANVITGNFIGIDATGNNAFSNGRDGIHVFNSTNNIIGGTTAAERNVISANIESGIEIDSSSDGNTIQGNFIGTDAAGAAPLGNTLDGILLGASSNAMIGGTAIGAGNLISGNSKNGIGLYTSGGSHTILGNIIGLNGQGNAAIANGESGIAISQSNTNIIGSSAIGGRNIISGNTNSGIYLTNTSNNTIVSNFIGRGSSTTSDLGNQTGVSFAAGANNNRLGGFGTNEGNVIAGSRTRGVDISTGAVANAILANRIISNTGLGIDLDTDGVTQNDAAPDADTGANGLQNYPQLYTSVIYGGLITITGDITSTANTTFAIQFFSNPVGTADVSGHGAGAMFIGYATVTTDGTGFASIYASFNSAGISDGDAVTALASVDLGSGAFGSTSEFSLNIPTTIANTAPVITNLGGDILAYNEDDGPVSIDTGNIANVSDSTSENFDTGQLTIRIASGYVANEDVLSIQNQGTGNGQISVTGTTVYFEGISIGSLSSSTNGSTLNISLNQNAKATATAQLVHAVTYQNTNTGTPTPGARTIIVNLNDGDGATSSDYSIQVNVTAINDPPIVSLGPTGVSFTEGGAPIFIAPLLGLSDVDSDNFDGGVLQISVIANSTPSDVLGINNQGMGAGQIGVSGNNVFFGGTLIGTFSSTSSSLTVALNANATKLQMLALIPNITFSVSGHDPVAATRQAVLTLSDGDGGTSAAQTKFIAINVDSTLWVSTENDIADGDTSNIFNLLANRGTDGAISLREAIIATNNTTSVGPNQINFEIPGVGTHRINLTSALPAITRSIVIDGGTQLGYAGNPLIEINGGAITEANGLTLSIGSNGSTIRGLSIMNFLGTASPGGHGIIVFSDSNVIQSNYIGIDASGNSAGNWVGLVINNGAKFNLVGGTTAVQGNVISGNTRGGISIGGVGTSFNRIEGNLIGVGADGVTARPNTLYGVNVWAIGDGNTIGGIATGTSNTISSNSNVGVLVDTAATVSILGNSISGNSSFGIDLTNDGPTQNDLNDTDVGANGLQNYPVISSVTSSGGFTTIIGNFNTQPSRTYRLEYFSSPTIDSTGYGGGKTLIGYSTIISGTDGNANINLTLGSVFVPVGYFVTATATQDFGSVYGGTSEFAKSVVVNAVFPGATVSPLSSTLTSESGTSVTFTVRLNTAPTGTVTIPMSSDKFWEGNVNTSNLTFTAANWNVDQTITVTGIDDSVVDGSHNYNIVFGNAVSTDPAYNAMKLTDIAVTNIDNDTRSVVVINTTADIADGDTSSLYALIRNLGADGKISLREAIQAANNTPNGFGGADEIQFNISEALAAGEHVISLTSALPTLNEAIVIDASTEPDWSLNANHPVIVIDGNKIVAPIIHLNAFADNSSIIGLVIRNSGSEGILIDAGSDNNTIIGNYIGSVLSGGTSAGTTAGNSTGIYIQGAGNIIGGVNISDRNVISGNAYGVVIGGTAAMSNFVVGNYIGTTATGNATIGNTYDGIQIQMGASSNTIGGNTAAHRNIISGNLGEGIEINGETTDNNIVRGNYIGVSADGLSNITPATNLGTGIYIVGGADNTSVGGSILGQGNWIAGAHYGGVVLDGVSIGTVIQGNRIGTDVSGLLNWGTGYNAVLIENGAGSTLIGGTSAISGNILANSGQISQTWTAGLTMIGPGTNNAALGNIIYGNVGIGIDLGNNGITANDLGDADNGVNGFQNYPTLGTALSSGGNTTITGSLNSNANTNYRIEFFSSLNGDAIGFVNVTTDATGNASFNTTLNGVSVAAGSKIKSTATIDLGGGNFGSTSEFSANATAGGSLSITGTVYEDINSNGQIADDGVGLGGAIVTLYRDNGDGVIGAGDTIVNNVNANASGQYSFNNVAAGTYWVVVDSRTLRSNAGLNAASTTLDQWAEQTYGSAGSVAWNGASYTFSASGGTFLGGMRSDRSDNGAGILTAEHVTRVTVGSASVSNIDYGFSYNVITNARDGDDVAANNLSIQGSLRQFIQNSNALSGVQSSQFRIPASDPNVASGVAVVSLTSALPSLNEAIIIDGTTQTTWGGNTNAAVLGNSGNVGENPVGLSQLQAPEIEIRGLTSNANIFKILGNNTTIRGLAILGGGIAGNSISSAIEVSASNVTIEQNLIGSHATAVADPGAANRIQAVGIRLLGQANLNNNIIAYTAMHGVSVEAGGSNSLISNNQFIYPATAYNTQAGVALRDVTGVQINGNLIGASGGNAIELTSNADNNFIRNNEIVNSGLLTGGDDNAIDILGGSDNNLIEGNRILASVGAGVYIAGSSGNKIGGAFLPQANRINNNSGGGVVLASDAQSNQSILRNVIYNNLGLGIDLGSDGVTLNDAAPDADIGPNSLQNFPVLWEVSSSRGDTWFFGSLRSTPNTTFRIEFFSATTAATSGYGQGETFLGFITVTTDASGVANYAERIQGLTLSPNTNVSATATVDLGLGNYGNTSEFAATVQSGLRGQSVGLRRQPNAVTTEAGGSFTFEMVLTGPPTADVTIPISIDNPLEANLSTNSLTFTAANWYVYQTVTVTGITDGVVDGNKTYQINPGPIVSADAGYNGMLAPNFSATNIDTTTQSTIVVTTANDIDDGDTSSLYALLSNKGADGRISLREAILAANNSTNGSGGSDKIYFNIADPLIGAAHTISLNNALPLLTDSVIIDGYSEPDSLLNPSAHVVVIDGNNIAATGLVITSSASDSTIRGMVIQGFGWNGIDIQLGSTNNTIVGNYIGQLTAQGTDAGAAKINGGSGIHVQGFNNKIGGATLTDRNVVSGNYAGITLRDGSNNLITGNFIGTDATGTISIANRDSGIYLVASTGNVIGGKGPGMGNLISGNTKSGIYLFNGADNNSIQGNYIGTDVTGTIALGNNLFNGTYYGGITAENVSGTLIGGSAPGAGNLISGNSINGISSITGGSGAVIAGNIIGLSSDGQTLLGNRGNGINIETGSLRIGGTTVGERNIISGNTQSGVRFTSASANNNIVSGNYIGTDATGLISKGNLGGGVVMGAGANNNTIGGLAATSGNVISGNTLDGVRIGTTANNNTVQANLIGIAANGTTALANSGAGVFLYDGSTNNLIGGTGSAAANKIAFNGTSGILLSNTGALSKSNAFLGNHIFSNTGLGIDLAPNGIYANDIGDADIGVNDLQNFPVLTSVVSAGGNTTINGAFNSTANQSFRLEFFTTPTGAVGNHGDATTFIGSIDVTTDATGNASFNPTYSGVTLTAGHIVTATATLKVNATQFGSTSGFSQNVPVAAALFGITVTPLTTLFTSEAGATSQFSVVLNSAPTADVTMALTSSNSAEGRLSTNLLTFTPLNWNIAQVVTVTGVNDFFVDGTKTYTIVIAPAVSADLSYNGLDSNDIVMNNTDNDTFNTLVVDTTSDAADGDTSSVAALYANKGGDGKISLREAILASNNTANGSQRDQILFNIADSLIAGAHTINVMSALPTITDAVLIDGTSEPDYSGFNRVIELNGTNAGISSGLVINSNGSQVNGLTINRFNVDGIHVTGSNNSITTNFIGVDTTGMIARANLRDGILLLDASNTIIGGSQSLGNVVAGNGNIGIEVAGATGSANVIIQNNLVGVNALANASLANGNHNIWIVGTGSTNFTIGGGAGLGGNIIGGSAGRGILISPNVSGGEVSFNAIGMNYGATANLGNVSYGLLIHGTSINVASNLIANNGGAGIFVASSASSINIVSNTISNEAKGVIVAGSASGIAISQNTMDGVGTLIDLNDDGATINDFNDVDRGPNRLQNTPLITSVSTDGTNQIRISGTYNGTANRTLSVEFFEHGTSGTSTRSRYVGTLSITTDAAGNANFAQVFSGAHPIGTLFSATATDVTIATDRTTSEHCVAIGAIQTSVIVTPTTGLIVTEGGSTATFTLALSAAPTADVVITLSPTISGEVSLSTTSITFTAANWNVAQTITITGLQDYVSDGAKNFLIVTSATTSTDVNFNGLMVADIAISTTEIANVAPVIVAPASYSLVEDIASNLGGTSTGLSIADADVGNGLLSVTISASNGVFSLGSRVGLTFSSGDGNADSTMTFQGTVGAINAAIDSIVLTPSANFSGLADLTITVNDLGNSGSGGAFSATRIIPINVAAVNDAPVLAGTRAVSVVEGGAVLITSAMMNLTDVDTTTTDLIFTIRATSGDGEFMRSGISLRVGDSFSQADIDSQLIQYAHFGGELSTASVDLGAGERLGIRLADFRINFSVLAVNDAPIINAISGAPISEISVTGTTVATVSASDSDNQNGLTFSLVNDAQGAFQINVLTGAITVLNPARIDYETATQMSIRIKVADLSGTSVERDFTVQIADFPEFVLPPTGGGDGTTTTGGTTAGGNTGGGTVGVNTDPTGTPTGTGTGGAGTTTTDVIGQPTSTINARPDSQVATVNNNADAKRGNQVKGFENIVNEVWIDIGTTSANSRKVNETGKKSITVTLLDQQEIDIETNRRRVLNSDSLEYLLNSNRKQKGLNLVPPNVILADFKLPSNAQSMPVNENSIDTTGSAKTFNVVIDAIEYSGMALSVGAVAWATRTGGLLAALISAIPAWKGLDPLLVLSSSKANKAKQFEDFSDTELRGDEEAVRAVL
jgi:trimeric autotransporter adhesin